MKRLLTILCIPALLLLGAISWPAAAAPTPQNSDRLETKPACVQSPIWNDKGSGADLDGFFFIPAVEQSFFMIGGYGSQTNAPRQSCVLSVRESVGKPSGAPKLLTPPKDWELIWADKGSGADQDGSFWKAIPPSSEYRCLGSVPQAGYGKPSLATYRCVHSSLTQRVSISELVWSDKGSGADKDVTLFKLPNAGSFVAVPGKANQTDTFDIKPDAISKLATARAHVPPSSTCKGSKNTWTNCFGTLTFPDGAKYAGEFKDGKPHGKGTVTLVDGRVLKGIWSNGKRVSGREYAAGEAPSGPPVAAKAPKPPPSQAAAAPAAAAPPSQTATLTKTFPDDPVDVSFQSSKPHPDDVAVIIGNADYEKQGRDIWNVTPAYADAEGIKRYFTQAKGVLEGNIIHLQDATGSQLTSVFGSEKSHKGQLFNWVKPNVSNVYVYYAGHGAPAGDEGTSYLVPSDATAATIELTGYPLVTLYKNLGKLPAKSITVILEACFSGTSQAGSLIPRSSGITIMPKVLTVPQNVTVISAGAANQIASWEEDSKHSLFTKYFLMAMSGEGDKTPHGNGDGKVTNEELEKYLEAHLTYYARRLYSRDQNAQIVSGVSAK